MTIPIIASICVVSLAVLFYAYWLVCRWQASRLVMIFVAQSLLIRNIQVDFRPRFIIQQCFRHQGEIRWVYRRLAMWYIENRGISVATAFLHYIITDARENPSIEIME
jgi:hypothetical protein